MRIKNIVLTLVYAIGSISQLIIGFMNVANCDLQPLIPLWLITNAIIMPVLKMLGNSKKFEYIVKFIWFILGEYINFS